MEVWVSFNSQKFTFAPDPARVKVGTPVTWRVQANGSQSTLIRWTVFFNHGSPLRSKLDELTITTTTQSHAGQHTGVTGAIAPNKPGDYKYGVRAEDAQTDEPLGEDDPYLIVTL